MGHLITSAFGLQLCCSGTVVGAQGLLLWRIGGLRPRGVMRAHEMVGFRLGMEEPDGLMDGWIGVVLCWDAVRMSAKSVEFGRFNTCACVSCCEYYKFVS